MFGFLKSAVLNGLLIALPVLFVLVIIKEFFELLIGFATPIANLLPEQFIDRFASVEVLASLLILGAALLVGIISKLPAGAAAGRFIERTILEKIHVYVPAKTLLRALLGTEESKNFRAALVHDDDGTAGPAYIVEDTGQPHLMVLIPRTPSSLAGSLKLVPRERVQELDMTFDAFCLRVGHYGVGLSGMLDPGRGSAVSSEN